MISAAELGKRLRAARVKKGTTQTALSKTLYIAHQTISDWERGANYPSLENMAQLAEELEFSMDKMLDIQQKGR